MFLAYILNKLNQIKKNKKKEEVDVEAGAPEGEKGEYEELQFLLLDQLCNEIS